MWSFDKFVGKTAIIDEFGVSLSYEDLIREGEKIYEAIGKRCLVFTLCENSVGSVVGYASFINNRVVPVLLNAHMERELLGNLLDAYSPSYLWVPGSMAEEFCGNNCGIGGAASNGDGGGAGSGSDVGGAASGSDVGGAGSNSDVGSAGSNGGAAVVYEAYDYALIKTCYDKDYPLNDELCLLLTTSGSTGSPKFVRQSYRNVLSNAESIVSYLELDETERPITTLPMNYTYGLSIINSHFLVGATLLVTDKGLMQKEFWNFFKEAGATSFGGVPYTYEMLSKLRIFRMDLPSLRYMTQAGGKITSELHQKFAEYAAESGKKFIVMYGQCEATARMGYLPANKALEKCGSMGIAIPGGKFTLIDVDDKEITSPDVAGELVYEGDNVTLGYAESGEDLIKGDERGGILRTGDVAKRDEDGYYFIVGRMKRFLKIYGNRVNLDEIDRLIKGRFEGIDVACAGVDDHMYIFLTKESAEGSSAEDGSSEGSIAEGSSTGDSNSERSSAEGSDSVDSNSENISAEGSDSEDSNSERSSAEGSKLPERVREYVAHTTKLNPTAFKVVVIDEIPKNDAGKTLYKELAKYYE